MCSQVPQQLRISVADTHHGPRDSLRGVTQEHRVDAGHRQIRAGNRVAVGVAGGMTEFAIDRVEEAVADGMFENLGLVVHLIPPVAVRRHEPGLDQPMAPHHPECQGEPAVGQADRTVGNVPDQPCRTQLLHHLGHARHRESESVGETRSRDLVGLPFGVRVDRPHVILGCTPHGRIRHLPHLSLPR